MYPRMLSQKTTISPPIVFNGIKIESKGEWEREYIETHYYRIKKTLEILDLKPKDRVLEIGCDSGLFSLILKERFKNIEHFAIEISSERIKMAILTKDEIRGMSIDDAQKKIVDIKHLKSEGGVAGSPFIQILSSPGA